MENLLTITKARKGLNEQVNDLYLPILDYNFLYFFPIAALFFFVVVITFFFFKHW